MAAYTRVCVCVCTDAPVYSLYIYAYTPRYDRTCSFNTAITLDPIINALIYVCPCVADQTREAVLHCGPGGGLASEYFLIRWARARVHA